MVSAQSDKGNHPLVAEQEHRQCQQAQWIFSQAWKPKIKEMGTSFLSYKLSHNYDEDTGHIHGKLVTKEAISWGRLMTGHTAHVW